MRYNGKILYAFNFKSSSPFFCSRQLHEVPEYYIRGLKVPGLCTDLAVKKKDISGYAITLISILPKDLFLKQSPFKNSRIKEIHRKLWMSYEDWLAQNWNVYTSGEEIPRELWNSIVGTVGGP